MKFLVIDLGSQEIKCFFAFLKKFLQTYYVDIKSFKIVAIKMESRNQSNGTHRPTSVLSVEICFKMH